MGAGTGHPSPFLVHFLSQDVRHCTVPHPLPSQHGQQYIPVSLPMFTFVTLWWKYHHGTVIAQKEVSVVSFSITDISAHYTLNPFLLIIVEHLSLTLESVLFLTTRQ